MNVTDGSKLYCYAMGPIDEFFRLPTAEDVAHRHRDDRAVSDALNNLAHYAEIGWGALRMFGPMQTGRLVFHFPVPGRLELSVGLIQKQVDNGMTFVATYIPMHEAPWFAKDLWESCVVDCATGVVSEI